MTQTESPSRPDITPPDVWRQKAIHTVTGPSGATFRIRIPGIGTLLEAGELPHHLVGLALLDISHREGAAAALRQMMDDVLSETRREELLAEVRKLGEYQRRIVAAAMVEPDLDYDDVASGEFPEDDLSMVAEIVQRIRAFDARGVRIGVEPLDRWATFHEEHGLDPEGVCEGCKRAVGRFSSVDVGGL
jgi:hypothetical protein